MSVHSRTLLMSAALATATLTACENQEAAQHRAATEAVRTATVTMQSLPANADKAASALQGVARDLRGLRGGSRTLEASAQRLLAKAELRLGEYAWHAGTTARDEATAASMTVAAFAAAVERRLGHAEHHDALVSNLTTDQLEAVRMATTHQHEAAARFQSDRMPDLRALEAANEQAKAESLALRVEAAALRRQADGVDGVNGQPLRIRAAELELRAADVEADMERRSAEIELQHRQVLDQLGLRVDAAADLLQVVDGEISRTRELADETRAQSKAAHQDMSELSRDLGGTAASLVELLTGQTQQAYEATLNHFEASASAATKAMRLGGRTAKDADRLASIRVQLAILTLAEAREARLADAIQLLELVSNIGEVQDVAGRWGETRQVLQTRLDEASSAAAKAGAAAADLASGMGDDLSALLLGVVETDPPSDD
ncbi:MAG: hypothetical protein QF733_01225 [Phycisphaerales bacterium]|nr:hypothetical protein [Phycisphaerales bacterium]